MPELVSVLLYVATQTVAWQNFFLSIGLEFLSTAQQSRKYRSHIHSYFTLCVCVCVCGRGSMCLCGSESCPHKGNKAFSLMRGHERKLN